MSITLTPERQLLLMGNECSVYSVSCLMDIAYQVAIPPFTHQSVECCNTYTE